MGRTRSRQSTSTPCWDNKLAKGGNRSIKTRNFLTMHGGFHPKSSTLSLYAKWKEGCLRAASRAVNDKEPLKKAKTPKGRFDNLEETSKDVLEKFPDDVNPVTKEKGGPRGPEPTRYGDWERKGRCVDF
uniref:Succinate dehydrogenase assembly factor 4, mitochondrial n=1 Tax=Oreochromis aureus TaxID=47969 RepID=A0AAZ1Y5D9_OREAU